MIAYNPKDWISFIFAFHKAETFRRLLPAMLAMAVYSGAVAFVEIEFWHLQDSAHLRNIGSMHNILGFVISLLLVFRTNTAYERWWDGRKLWGDLVNVSRNLAIKLSAMLPAPKDRDFFAQAIPQFAAILKTHLQGDPPDLKALEALGIASADIKHLPNAVSRALISRLNLLYRTKKISGDQFIVLGRDMQTFTDVCGGCERIKNSPIPYSYSAFIKKFIFFYTMTMPFGYAFSLGYYMIPVVIFIFYALASLELIAEEIEDPFGKDANDLPLPRLVATIEQNIVEIFAGKPELAKKAQTSR